MFTMTLTLLVLSFPLTPDLLECYIYTRNSKTPDKNKLWRGLVVFLWLNIAPSNSSVMVPMSFYSIVAECNSFGRSPNFTLLPCI